MKLEILLATELARSSARQTRAFPRALRRAHFCSFYRTMAHIPERTEFHKLFGIDVKNSREERHRLFRI